MFSKISLDKRPSRYSLSLFKLAIKWGTFNDERPCQTIGIYCSSKKARAISRTKRYNKFNIKWCHVVDKYCEGAVASICIYASGWRETSYLLSEKRTDWNGGVGDMLLNTSSMLTNTLLYLCGDHYSEYIVEQ